MICGLKRSCRHCGKPFIPPRMDRVREGRAVFCSKDCFSVSWRKRPARLVCAKCGKDFASRGWPRRHCEECHPPWLKLSLEERLWSRVTRGGPDECWPWTGFANAIGYGIICAHRKPRLAHRIALSLALGRELLRHECACHHCDNPRCCNPAHLFVGTHAQNMADMVRKGRQVHGERVGGAKLTAADVRAIRALKVAGQTTRAIGEMFGVSCGHISGIVNHLEWRHVPDEEAAC